MMKITRAFSKLVLAAAFPMLLIGVARAQGPVDLSSTNRADAPAAPTAARPLPDAPSTAQTSDNWHSTVAIYGWFPGINGTVGALGHDAGLHVPFYDIWHSLKGIIPIAVEADKGRFVMPIDFFWVKLGDGTATPLTDVTGNYINAHLTESIFTPMAGYRLLDGQHLKIDALGGIRYWYVGENLQLIGTPVQLPAFVRSQNWVDGLGGARFILPLSEKAAITVSGDAGAGGANLDYQAVGLLTFNVTQKIGVGVGWRYLDVDYRPSTKQFVFDTAITGPVAGVHFNFGGKPPVPPSASCSVSPVQVQAGEPVRGSASTQDFKPKHAVDYRWSGNSLKVSGSGDTANVDTTGLAPGSYALNATATDPKEKKNNSASCSATFTVLQPPPKNPPVASCSASPATVKAGDPATIAVNASSPDGVPLSYAYTTSAGNVSGSGASARLDTSSAQPGSAITTTAMVTDSRGLSTSCVATVNVLTPPVTVQEVKEIGECKFMNPKKPWRVDNECKAVLDDVALRIQQEPNGKLVVVGYAEEEEVVDVQQLGSQRAVNIKYYLTAGEGQQRIDAARIQPVKGSQKSKSAKLYFVPAGASFTAEETVSIDETVVKGQSRTAPAPKKKATSANSAK